MAVKKVDAVFDLEYVEWCSQHKSFNFLYSYYVFYAIITLLMRIKIPRFLTCIRNRGIKKANLELWNGQISFNAEISITEILKSSRVEVKKTSKQKLARRSFRYQANQQDKVVKRDRYDRAISSNKSISESM